MKNVLVQYQGGGYDGCIWEWNFFFIDGDGNFHDVYSSGHAGIKDAAGLYVLDMDDDDVFVVDLTDAEAIEEFSRESNAVCIAGVLQWFNDNPQDGIEFFAMCSDCGGHITEYEDVCLEEWHGCGGIASTADSLLCTDCRNNSTCCCCSEYVGKDGFDYERDMDECDESILQELAEYDENNGPMCQYCWEAKRDDLIKEWHEDLAWRSFAFGEPDRFSDAMRWFWGLV